MMPGAVDNLSSAEAADALERNEDSSALVTVEGLSDRVLPGPRVDRRRQRRFVFREPRRGVRHRRRVGLRQDDCPTFDPGLPPSG